MIGTKDRQQLEVEALADEFLNESDFIKNTKRIQELKMEYIEFISKTGPASPSISAIPTYTPPISPHRLNDFVIDQAGDLYLEELNIKREDRKAKEAMVRSGRFAAAKQFDEDGNNE